ncbi:hypothetical protein Csa_004740, partial [Cucumis sativus]
MARPSDNIGQEALSANFVASSFGLHLISSHTKEFHSLTDVIDQASDKKYKFP